MNSRFHFSIKGLLVLTLCLVLGSAVAQDSDDPDAESASETPAEGQQDDVSKALDSTATQWSFQFAWQGSTWKDDEVDGSTRPQGLDHVSCLPLDFPGRTP